jgi:dimethylargininase
MGKNVFTRAIVRPPGDNFKDGLTNVDLGTPDYELVRRQHQAYCHALEQLGLTLTRLEVDPQHPDSTFVEDTAILTGRCAIIARPGAITRAGEVESIEPVIMKSFSEVRRIEDPGTLDGGDVCEAGEHFFIGMSRRTNEHGAQQLANILQSFAYTATLIDIRDVSNILHLKSGLSYVGDNSLVVIDALQDQEAFRGYSLIHVSEGSEYAANCLRANDSTLIPSGFPDFEDQLRKLGYKTVALEMSEFQKMDGGLSCLSLRW